MDTRPVDVSRYEHQLRVQDDRELLLVASHPTGVSGWATLKHYSDREGYAYAGETSVYVDRSARGRGVGSQLQLSVMNRARGLGYRHLAAKVLAVNEHSIHFHERFAYEVIGRQREIGFLNGRWHDVIILQHLILHPQPAAPRSPPCI